MFGVASVQYGQIMGQIHGEVAQAKGADGARRAKRWLDSTTRVNVQWVNPDPYAVPKLTFKWPHGGTTFSFDLGGVFKFDDLDGQAFFAESKKYDKPSDLGTHYVKYLAQCYVAYGALPAYCDNFMWVSWAPPLSSRWDELCTSDFVREAVIKHHKRVFGVDTETDAERLVDDAVCADVAARLWLIVLSDRQEALVISKDHRSLVDAHEIRNEK